MTNKEKYLQMITGRNSNAVIEAKKRIENRDWSDQATIIAIKISTELKQKGWTARMLAEKLNVSPQYVSKLLQGNEKFGFDILVKIQKILSIPIFIDFNEKFEVKSKARATTGTVVEFDFCSKPTKSIKNQNAGKIISLFQEEKYLELKEN